MRVKRIDTFQTAIQECHGCLAEHVDSVYIHEISPGGRLWEGAVEIFATDHPDAGRCYAWSAEDGDPDARKIVAVLGRTPIGSARMAVRAALRLNLLGVLAAAMIYIGAAAPAGAATLSLSGSTLALTIGALPGVIAPQNPNPVGGIEVSVGGGFSEPAGILSAAVIIPKDLFTGVNLISSINMTYSNGAGTFAPAGGFGGGFGGSEALVGQATVGVLGGLINLLIPLAPVGLGGTTKAGAFTLLVTVTGAPWTTGVAAVTGITTSTTPGLTKNTVTVSGFDNRTAGGVGAVMLVSPVRILTNAAGNLPAFAIQVLNFVVPEPGTLLLFGSGVFGLAFVGRERMRK